MTRIIFQAACLVCALSVAISLPAQRATPAPQSKPVYLSFAEAEPVIEALEEILPDELKGQDRKAIAAKWNGWTAKHDAEIRARLAQGDEDSLINFLLFGTSFTRQPRLTLSQLQEIKNDAHVTVSELSTATGPIGRVIAARLSDLVKAAAVPRTNDRLSFARKVFTARGFNLLTAAGRQSAQTFLMTSLQRIISENTGYARVLEAARLQGDASEEFAERSRLFRTRGLSSDTSILPNYALEQALSDLKARGLLSSSGVSRVAIIGPGLDFTDKQEGYDFYPQQTIQPFAVIDSLLRLGLTKPDQIQIVTLDLSPRVNEHLIRAKDRGLRGQPYDLQLPRDEQAQWKPQTLQYWQRFGDRIGTSITPVTIPPDLSNLKVRAVRIRPSLVTRISPLDLNIVLQRINLPPAQQFDLVVATNILVYYDNFEQSLALLNIERMLKPGGFLLSNNALLEFPFFKLHSVGYSTVVYSERPDDGDHIVWYQRGQ